jgi:hypothetical protein
MKIRPSVEDIAEPERERHERLVPGALDLAARGIKVGPLHGIRVHRFGIGSCTCGGSENCYAGKHPFGVDRPPTARRWRRA